MFNVAIDHNKVLLSRNKTKLQHKTYLYEGMKNIILSNGFTVSEFSFSCTAMAIEKMNGKKLEYLKSSDRLILNKIRRAIYVSTSQLVAINLTFTL